MRGVEREGKRKLQMDSEMAQSGVDDDPDANYLEWDKMTDR